MDSLYFVVKTKVKGPVETECHLNLDRFMALQTLALSLIYHGLGVCVCVCSDNAQVSTSALSYKHVHNHGIADLYYF